MKYRKNKKYYVDFIAENGFDREIIQARNCGYAVEEIRKKYPDVQILKSGRAVNLGNDSFQLLFKDKHFKTYKSGAVSNEEN